MDVGDADLEERLLRDVGENHVGAICQTALEGLAANWLNLEMLVERRARAQERRVVPETIARFMNESAEHVPFQLKRRTTTRVRIPAHSADRWLHLSRRAPRP